MKRYWPVWIMVVLLLGINDLEAGDSTRFRKDQLFFKMDILNAGNYLWLGGGFGLGYYRSINNYVDAGAEIAGNFGPALYSNSDVYSMSAAFIYKAIAEYKPVSGQKHIFKIGLGFTGSILGGDNLFGLCNKFTYQVNRKKKTVVGLYLYNDLYLNRELERPLDIFGFGFFVGGRF